MFMRLKTSVIGMFFSLKILFSPTYPHIIPSTIVKPEVVKQQCENKAQVSEQNIMDYMRTSQIVNNVC